MRGRRAYTLAEESYRIRVLVDGAEKMGQMLASRGERMMREFEAYHVPHGVTGNLTVALLEHRPAGASRYRVIAEKVLP